MKANFLSFSWASKCSDIITDDCINIKLGAQLVVPHYFFGLNKHDQLGDQAGRCTCDGEFDTNKSMGAGDGGSGGLQSLLSNVGGPWGSEEYEEEYDLDEFLDQLS